MSGYVDPGKWLCENTAEAKQPSSVEGPRTIIQNFNLGAGAMSTRRIGNYQITEYLGGGGFGSVFKAEDVSSPGRVVAIKELHKKHTRNPVIKQRFFQEAVAMARLDHPNLPRLYTFGEDNGCYYLVMEFLSGRSLSDEIHEDGALAPDTAVAIMSQTLEALSYAHRNGIIHRDLKPDNIMLLDGDSLRIKVLDFGIARMVGGENLTMAGEGFGTPAYMSPERLSGSTTDDPRIDIYSAGIILFEMLTGRAPFESSASDPVMYWTEMRKYHETEPLPQLALLSISPGLERIVTRATAKRIEDRYATADDMLADLKKISAGIVAVSTDAPAVAAGARLFLTTAPASAEVYVDDELRGTSDAIRGKILIDRLAPGLHTVRVIKAGYSEYRINVALEEGKQTDLQVALPARATVAMPPAEQTAAGGFDTVRLEGNEAKTALFIVESLPAGTTIFVGANAVAQADEDGRATIRLTPGNHEIEAKSPQGAVTRRMITVNTSDTGSQNTMTMPMESSSDVPTMRVKEPVIKSAPPATGQTARLTKGRRMAAAATIVLIAAIVAVAYFVLRGPARGNAQSDAPVQSTQLSAINAPDADKDAQAGIDPETQARMKKAAEDRKKAEAEAASIEAEKKAIENPANATDPQNPPAAPPVAQVEPPPVVAQEACVGVFINAPIDLSMIHFRVIAIEQPGTASPMIANGRTNERGIWRRCGFTAGHRVRVTVMGPRGAVNVTRELMLSPGMNRIDLSVSDLPAEAPRFPPRMKRPGN